jgi:hypothetical protein
MRDSRHLPPVFWTTSCDRSKLEAFETSPLRALGRFWGREAIHRATALELSGQSTDGYIVSVQISKRELFRLSVRVEVRLFVEPFDQIARPYEGQLKIIDTKEQEKTVAW